MFKSPAPTLHPPGEWTLWTHHCPPFLFPSLALDLEALWWVQLRGALNSSRPELLCLCQLLCGQTARQWKPISQMCEQRASQ